LKRYLKNLGDNFRPRETKCYPNINYSIITANPPEIDKKFTQGCTNTEKLCQTGPQRPPGDPGAPGYPGYKEEKEAPGKPGP